MNHVINPKMTIGEIWEAYRNSQSASGTEEEMEAVRRIFYFGALAYSTIMSESLKLGTKEGRHLLVKANNDLADFMKGL